MSRPSPFSLAALAAAVCLTAGCGRSDSGVLRVSMPLDKPASYYDPARTRHAFGQYFFLENIYSPLLEYTPDGKLVSAAAEHFELRGGDAYFSMRRGLITAGGHELDAYDTEASLKRLFILDRETHGALENALCGGRRLVRLTDPCPGIAVHDGGRTLSLKFPEPRPLIFQTLAAAEFSVIPKNSIDPATLAITGYRETSGPYYVSRDAGAGNISLRANPRHFHYSAAMPQEVVFVPYDPAAGKSPLKMFIDGSVDHVTTLEKVPCDEMIDFARDHARSVGLHRTYPIKLFIVAFTAKGRRALTEQERWAAGKAMKAVHNRRVLTRSGYENADQILTLEGTLSESALKAIERKFAGSRRAPITAKRIIAWDGTGVLFENAAELMAELPALKVLKVHKNPNFTDFRKENLEEPDLYVGGYNVGLQDDIGLMGYHLNAGTLLPAAGTKEDWMKDYAGEPDKARRFERMRSLQYESLEHAVSVPLATMPYTALLRKPWTFAMSRHLASNPIWRIRRN